MSEIKIHTESKPDQDDTEHSEEISQEQISIEVETHNGSKKEDIKTKYDVTDLAISKLKDKDDKERVFAGCKTDYIVMKLLSNKPELTNVKSQALQENIEKRINFLIPFGGSLPKNAPGPLFEDEPKSRNDFVKRVFAIVLLMILATSGFLALVLSIPSVKDFFKTNGLLILIPGFIVLIIVTYGFMCSPCTRIPPCNIIFLCLAVVAVSLIAGKVTASYETEVIVYATLATACVLLLCITLAFSKFDFTSWILYVIGMVFALVTVSFVAIGIMITSGKMMKPLLIALLLCGTLFMVIMIVIELQAILGGRSVQIYQRDYAIAAFLLYMSIVEIFLRMVNIIGISR